MDLMKSNEQALAHIDSPRKRTHATDLPGSCLTVFVCHLAAGESRILASTSTPTTACCLKTGRNIHMRRLGPQHRWREGWRAMLDQQTASSAAAQSQCQERARS